jgi:ribonuclease E
MPNIGDSDDDWAELARELSRDRPQTPVEPSLPVEEVSPYDDGLESTAAPDEGEDAPESFGDSEGEGAPDGQPGTGRKRRRRRRRRRRGGIEQASDAPAEGTPETEKPEPVESADEEFESSEIGYSDEEDSEFVPVDAEADSDEDAGEELLRDLIANWNVPSWDDVVAGLYRPER